MGFNSNLILACNVFDCLQKKLTVVKLLLVNSCLYGHNIIPSFMLIEY